MLKWPHPKKFSVLIPDLHHCKTFQVSPESLATAGQQWAETSSLWINPLLFCTPLHMQMFILLSSLSSQRGDFISPKLFQKLLCASSAFGNAWVKPLGLFQGKVKKNPEASTN